MKEFWIGCLRGYILYFIGESEMINIYKMYLLK